MIESLPLSLPPSSHHTSIFVGCVTEEKVALLTIFFLLNLDGRTEVADPIFLKRVDCLSQHGSKNVLEQE